MIDTGRITAPGSLTANEWETLRGVGERRKEERLPVLRELYARACRDLVRRPPDLPTDAERLIGAAGDLTGGGAYRADFGEPAARLLARALECRRDGAGRAPDLSTEYLCDLAGGWERAQRLTVLLARGPAGTTAQVIVQRRPRPEAPTPVPDPVGTMFVGLGAEFHGAVAAAWEHVCALDPAPGHDVRWWVRPDPGDDGIDGASAGAAFAALFAVCLDPQGWRSIAPGWAVLGALEAGPPGRIARVSDVPTKLAAARRLNLSVVVPEVQITECDGRAPVFGAGTVPEVVEHVVQRGDRHSWPRPPADVPEIVAAGVERVRSLVAAVPPAEQIVVSGPTQHVAAVCAQIGYDERICAEHAGGMHWVGGEGPASMVLRHQLGLSPDVDGTAIPARDADGGRRLAVLVDVEAREPVRAGDLPGWTVLVAGSRSRYGKADGWVAVDLDDTLRAGLDQLAERAARDGRLDRIVWRSGMTIRPDDLRRWWPEEGQALLDQLVDRGLARKDPDGYVISEALDRVLDGRADPARHGTEFLTRFGHEPHVRRRIRDIRAEPVAMLPTMGDYERLLDRIREDGWQAAVDDVVASLPATDGHPAVVVDALWAARGAGEDAIHELPGALIGRCGPDAADSVVAGLRAGAVAHHERAGTVTVAPLAPTLGGPDDVLVRVHDLHSPLDAVAVSPSGQLVAAATRSGRVRVWEHERGTPDGAERCCTVAHQVEALTCDDDGVVVICTAEPAVLRWDPAHAAPEPLDVPAPARPARPVPLGATVLLACPGNGLAVVGRHLVERAGPFDAAVTAVAAVDAGLLIGTAAGTLGLHAGRPDVVPLRSWRLDAAVVAVHAQRTGRLAVVAAENGRVVVVDLAHASAAPREVVDGVEKPETVLITDDGRVVVGSASRVTVHGRDGRAADLGAHLDHVRGVALLSEERDLVAVQADGRIHRSTLDGGRSRSWSAHGGRISAVQPAGPGPLVLTGSYDRTVRAWDLRRSGRSRPHRAAVTHLVTGGRCAVSAGADGRVLRWSWGGGETTTVLAEGVEVTHAVASGAAAFWADTGGGLWRCGWDGGPATRFATVSAEITALGAARGTIVAGTVTGALEVFHADGSPGGSPWVGDAPVRAVSTDGTGLVVAGTDAGAVVLRLTGPDRVRWAGDVGHVGAVTVTAHGGVVLGTSTGVTVLVDRPAGTTWETEIPAAAPVGLLLARDGDRTAVLAAAVNGRVLGMPLGWDSFELTDLPVAVLAATRLRTGGVADAVLLAEDGTVTFWDLERWRPVRRFVGNRSFTTVADGGAGPAGTPVVVAGDISGAVHRLEVRP